MLLSRSKALLTAVKILGNRNILAQPVRNSHQWNYRVSSPPVPKKVELAAEIIAGFAWWWVLWHLVTEPGHITGEFTFPNASKWTDAELGIPID